MLDARLCLSTVWCLAGTDSVFFVQCNLSIAENEGFPSQYPREVAENIKFRYKLSPAEKF